MCMFAVVYYIHENAYCIMSNLWKTKSIEQLVTESKGHGNNRDLKKVLTTWSLIALCIGAIIGAGLFSLTGIAAA